MPFVTPSRRAAQVALRGLVVLLAASSAPTAIAAGALRAQSSSPVASADTLPPPRDAARRLVGVLRPGDQVNVFVFRNKELTGEFVVDAAGNIQIPGLGEIAAGGVSPTEIKERIRQEMIRRGFQDPDIAVLPALRVSVLGEVRKPGAYPVDPGTSLLQLLTLAGGPTEAADLAKARVVREGRAFPVDLQSALTGSASGRVVLYSNDVLVIPKRTGLTRENLQFVFAGAGLLLGVANLVVSLVR
jgi:polysaccharide export outer membrane protein